MLTGRAQHRPLDAPAALVYRQVRREYFAHLPQDTSQTCGIEHGGTQDANTEKMDANNEELEVQTLENKYLHMQEEEIQIEVAQKEFQISRMCRM